MTLDVLKEDPEIGAAAVVWDRTPREMRHRSFAALYASRLQSEPADFRVEALAERVAQLRGGSVAPLRVRKSVRRAIATPHGDGRSLAVVRRLRMRAGGAIEEVGRDGRRAIVLVESGAVERRNVLQRLLERGRRWLSNRSR